MHYGLFHAYEILRYLFYERFKFYFFHDIKGATSINKIGEVRLFSEIGGAGFENLKKTELYNYY